MHPENQPLVFANRVIRRLVDNTHGNDVILTRENYLAIRTVFKRCGGSWQKLYEGNEDHTRLLIQIVASWGKKTPLTREVSEQYEGG